MVSNDKDHIYRLIQHGRDEITAEIGNLEREVWPANETLPQSDMLAGGSLLQEVHLMKIYILEIILQDILLFKERVIQEIEGPGEVSFDSVLIIVEIKCKQWKESLRWKQKLSSRLILLRP